MYDTTLKHGCRLGRRLTGTLVVVKKEEEEEEDDDEEEED